MKRRQPPPHPRRQCRDCMAPLKEGAIKCSDCGSFQNWQRRIQGLQVLLGFVLLILTLFAIQPIKDLILGKYPEIHAAIVSADSERISVVLSNSGNGTAALEGINIFANTKSSGPWQGVLSFSDLQDRILKPGDIKVVSIPHHHQIPEVAEPGVVGVNRDCNLSTSYLEVDGAHVRTEGLFRCYIGKLQ